MMSALFFFAFLARFWLLLLLGSWMPGLRMHRKYAVDKWEWYRAQPLWPYGLLKPVFLYFNGQVVYPLRGSFIALSVIACFVFLQRYASNNFS